MKRSKFEHALSRYHHRYVDERLKKIEVSRPEASFLKRMYNVGGVIQMNRMVEALGYHKSHVTRATSQLVKAGCVTKEINQDDKRGYIVTLTDKGRDLAKKVIAVLDEWDNFVNTVITDEERKVMDNITEKVYYLLKDYYSEEGNQNE